jgi:hypothetical protein
LEIYRYLLLPEPEIILGEIAFERNRCVHGDQNVDEDEDEDEDEWVDEESTDSEDWPTDGSAHGCVCGMCSDLDATFDSSDTESDMPSEFTEDQRRYPSILRANRQIYRESSTLLYSEATFTIDPDDILCLSKSKKDLHTPFFPNTFEPYIPSNIIWRYDPRKGVGFKNRKGDTIYKSPKLEGILDPHVFARFRKIKFDCYLDQDQLAAESSIWIDDTTLTLNQSHVAEYQKAIERLPIYKGLVKILSHSQHIADLSVSLEADVRAMSTAIERAEMDEPDTDDEEEEEWQELEERASKSQEAANEKAAEALMDSNMFDPLLKLSNVEHFHFAFTFVHLTDKNPYKPSPAHVKKIANMKTLIEGKFKERHPS